MTEGHFAMAGGSNPQALCDVPRTTALLELDQWPKLSETECVWEFLRYALRLHLLFSLFGDKSNTSMDMSGSGRIPPLPNFLVHLLSYNLVAAAGTERWLT